MQIAHPANRALLGTGAILGVGLVSSLDEVVLHQLLRAYHPVLADLQ